MPIPDFTDYGAETDAGVGSSNAARTPNLPGTFSVGQTLLCFISSDGVAPTLQTANGWQLAQDPAGNTASAAIAGQTSIAIYWKRATAARTGGGATSEVAPIINDPAVWGGTCYACHISVYSNVRTSDTPFHKIATSTVTSATTAISIPSVVTTLADCLLLAVASSANDDSTFNSWGCTGTASPGGTIDSGWHTATGNDTSWAGGRGGKAVAGAAGSFTSTFGSSTQQAQISFALASLAEPGTNGNAAITLDDDTVSGTASIELIGSAAITLDDDIAVGADIPSGNANIILEDDSAVGTGTIDLIGDATITLDGDVVASTATGPQPWGVGASTVIQRSNAFGPSTGTLTTNPISTTTGRILVVFIARGKWDLAGVPSPKGPTDSQGNTWTPVPPGAQSYAGYPDSLQGLWWCVNVAGSPTHTFSAAWGPYGTGAPGNPGDEVTVGVVELIGPVMLDSSTHVERASAASISGSAVIPTGPSIVFAGAAGGGPTGQTHVFTGTSGAVAAGWVNVPGASANGDPFPGVGYIQWSPWILVDESGSLAGQSVNIGLQGTANEGAQINQAVFQLAAGILGVGAITTADDTATGEGSFPIVGDAAITLADDSVSSAASIDIAGTGSITLDDDTVGATAALDVNGNSAIVLDDDSASGAGSIDVSGAANITLDDDTASGDTTPPIVGDAAITLGDDSTSATGSIELIGDAAITLADDTATGGVFTEVSGDASITLADDTATATGSIELIGNAAITLDDDVSASAAPPPPPLSTEHMIKVVVSNVAAIIDVSPRASTAKLIVASRTLFVNVGGPMRTEQMYLGETKPIYVTHTRDGTVHSLSGSVITITLAKSVDAVPIATKSTTAGTVTIAGDGSYAQSAIAADDAVGRGEYVLKVEIVWMAGATVSERYIQLTNLSVR